MPLFWVNGQVVDDQEGHVPEGSPRVNTFKNPAQYGAQEFGWDPANRYFSGNIQSNAPGYLTEMFGRLDRQRSGQLKPWEAEELGQWEATARAMPTRDIGSLTAGWQGDLQGQWTEGGWQEGAQDWWSRLDPGSPDAGGVMLALRDKAQAGTATPQERALYEQVREMSRDWDWRASVPQESDANPFGLGDNLFGALFTIGLGSGMAGLAPLAAGTVTAGSLGAGASTLGGIASLIGPPTGQDWLTKAGAGLSLASTLGSLPTLLSRGVTSLADAGRLASAGGRLARGVGGLTGNEALTQTGDVLGLGGALSGGVDTLSRGITNFTDAARLAQNAGQVAGPLGRLTGSPGLQQASQLLNLGGRLGGGVQSLLDKAQQGRQQPTAPLTAQEWLRLTGQQETATQTPAARTMSDDDWLRWTGTPGPWQ